VQHSLFSLFMSESLPVRTVVRNFRSPARRDATDAKLFAVDGHPTVPFSVCVFGHCFFFLEFVGTILLIIGASQYERYNGIVVPTTCQVGSAQQFSSTCQECSKTGCHSITCYKGSISISCCGYCRQKQKKKFNSYCFNFSFVAARVFLDSGLNFASPNLLRQRLNACKTIELERCLIVCFGLLMVWLLSLETFSLQKVC